MENEHDYERLTGPREDPTSVAELLVWLACVIAFAFMLERHASWLPDIVRIGAIAVVAVALLFVVRWIVLLGALLVVVLVATALVQASL